jgi:universal stress protein A
MIALQKILVATDFSAPSEAALAYARELARTFGASLHLVHVVEPVYSSLGIDGFLPGPEIEATFAEGAHKQLTAMLENGDRAAGAHAVVLTANAIPEAITACASEAGIDLIVMGTHGRSGVAHLLMGSVAERVVRTAPCPVLTVRHAAAELAAPDAPKAA